MADFDVPISISREVSYLSLAVRVFIAQEIALSGVYLADGHAVKADVEGESYSLQLMAIGVDGLTIVSPKSERHVQVAAPFLPCQKVTQMDMALLNLFDGVSVSLERLPLETASALLRLSKGETRDEGGDMVLFIV